MLLNWDTIDACFLFPTLQIKSSFEFFAACVGAFLLVISLEFLRRGQRQFDRYLQSKNRFLGSKRYIIAEEIEEKLLDKENEENIPKRDMKPRITKRVVLEQLVRGLIQMAQFSISYCIMLLFMYSNGTYLYDRTLSSSEVLTLGRLPHYIHSFWGSDWLRAIHQRHTGQPSRV
jgi:copper transporter 1